MSTQSFGADRADPATTKPADEDRCGGRNTLTRFADADLCTPGNPYLGELCEGHPAGPFDPMGETVYCDGRCQS